MKCKKIQEKEKMNLQLKNKKKQKLKEKGITLIALVVTIIILLILAGVTITFALGENGIITKAKEARKAQIIGETKEAIGLEITEAYTEAVIRGEGLEKKQVEDIVNKYGELQEDGDTIITKKDGYEISLKEIYYGSLEESGSYSAKLEQIEELEEKISKLENENTTLKGTPRKRINLGTARSIDVKAKLQSLGYDSNLYKSLTIENFAVEEKVPSGNKSDINNGISGRFGLRSTNISYSYNSSTGILSMTGGTYSSGIDLTDNRGWHGFTITSSTTAYLFV